MPRRPTQTAMPKGVTLLPSGRFRARLTFEGTAHAATFDSAKQASAWLRRTRGELEAGTHETQATPPTTQAPTFAEYAERWMRERPLRPRTITSYRSILDRFLLPAFGPSRLDSITVTAVREWHAGLCPEAPAMRAHTYKVLRAIMSTAFADDVIVASPCRVRGGAKAKRQTRTEIPTPAQVAQLADTMPSAKYRLMLLVCAWCGLRFGELAELRRKDIMTIDGLPVVIRVRRAVVRAQRRYIVAEPKTDAGVRDVAIPPHIRAELRDYLAGLPDDPERLLFGSDADPDLHLSGGQHHHVWKPVRESVGLPHLRWHDLRHFSATMAALGGATVAELQARIGHTTPTMALHYQHAAQGRDAVVAEAMSALAANVIPLRPAVPIVVEPDLSALLDQLAPPGPFQREWIATANGVWHEAGATPSRAYCGREVPMSQSPRYHTGDRPPGRVCRACAARRAAAG